MCTEQECNIISKPLVEHFSTAQSSNRNFLTIMLLKIAQFDTMIIVYDTRVVKVICSDVCNANDPLAYCLIFKHTFLLFHFQLRRTRGYIHGTRRSDWR